MVNIPSTIKNSDLYYAYYSLLDKVIHDYQPHFNQISQFKEARKSLTYNPSLKQYLTPLPGAPEGYIDPYLEEHKVTEDITVSRIVDFTIDGLYEELKDLDEYKKCVKIIDSDNIINKQVGKSISLSLLGSIQYMDHWKYISHFLKTMMFKYFDNYEINQAAFNEYYRNLESFFYRDDMEVMDISPLHHIKLVTLGKDHMPIPVRCSIILSDNLRIVPVTYEDKIRFWNKFPMSHIDRSFEEIHYFLQYRYTMDKGYKGTQDQRVTLDVSHHFFTIVTLLRFLGITCGIHDKMTATKLDLPIRHYTINLFVVALGVAYNTQSYLILDILEQFKTLWDKYGNLLVRKVLNYQRFDGDPFANLKISMNRFNDAYDRKDGTDAFIDNVVALEALFSKEDDKFSRRKTERLSKRLAVFLETDLQKREVILCEMIDLYDQRNEIIHGGYSEKYDIVKTRDYLVRSYLKYFNFLNYDNFSHTDLIKGLDKSASQIHKTYDDCKKENTLKASNIPQN